MKAYLISPETQAIEETDVSSEDDITGAVSDSVVQADVSIGIDELRSRIKYL